MALTTLLPQSGTAGTTGNGVLIGGASVTNLQFNPQVNVGFTGTVIIEGSSAPSPGANDWVPLISCVFSVHTSNFSIDAYSDVPWIRARISSATAGAVSVYASA